MSDQLSQGSSSSSEPNLPNPASPTGPKGVREQGTTSSLPISPYTHQEYDPTWATVIQKGGSKPSIQQVMKPEIERKDNQ